jgi:hypothetical protein
MKSLVLTLALLASSFPVIADDEDINWYRVTANSLMFVDMLQTVEISKKAQFTESNNILGPRPSEREVYQYFALLAVVNNLIGESLPSDYSDIFYSTASFIHLTAIHQNIQVGVKIKF